MEMKREWIVEPMSAASESFSEVLRHDRLLYRTVCDHDDLLLPRKVPVRGQKPALSASLIPEPLSYIGAYFTRIFPATTVRA